jgi:hypothetical protein
MKFLTGAAFFIFNVTLLSAQSLTGKICDKVTKEPVAFAHVVLSGTNLGITTDIDGRFKLSGKFSASDTLIISHVGYEKRFVSLNYHRNDSIIVYINPLIRQLKEVVVKAGEDPALLLMRKVVKHKPAHNPNNLQSYQFNSYTKLVMRKQFDTLSTAKPSYMFVSESASETKHVKPNKHVEKLLSHKVTGFTSPLFASLPTDYQPLGFYEDYITIIDNEYISPISTKSLRRYDFQLTDTLLTVDEDTLFTLSFMPLGQTDTRLLKGDITISTKGYAIKNIVAQSTDPHAKISFRIQQNYQQVSGHWFPVQLNTDFYFTELSIKEIVPMFEVRSYLYNIRLNESIEDYHFGTATRVLQEQPVGAIAHYRQRPLNSQEEKTYAMYDSLKSKMKIVTFLENLTEAFVWNRWPAGMIDIDLSKLLIMNRYEEYRPGFGFITNPRFSKIFSIGAFAGYGVNDEQWKYGGDIKFNLWPRKELYFQVHASNNLVEIGSQPILTGVKFNTTKIWRDWQGEIFDEVEQLGVGIGLRLLPDIRVKLSGDKIQSRPLYDYALTVNGEPLNHFTLTESSMEIQYIPNEVNLDLKNRKTTLKVGHPLLSVRYTQGLHVTGGQFDYTRYDFVFKHRWNNNRLGRTDIYLDAGWVDGISPLGRLYVSPGATTTGFMVDNHFQTLKNYEFISTQHVTFFFSQNILKLYNQKVSAPELIVKQGLHFSKVSNADIHQQVSILPASKGLYESGVVLDKILRIGYLNMLYFNLGIGGFYRYGHYASDKKAENLAVKFSFSISF